MSNLPRINPRTHTVSEAQSRMTRAFYDTVEAHSLTSVEALQILNHLEAGFLRGLLRSERHPEDPERPADTE